jgi:DNA-binding beta-propeller fold protein YncE
MKFIHKKSLILNFLTFILSFVVFSTAVPAEGSTLYVCNQGEATIDLFDMKTLERKSRVDLTELGFSKNAKPHHALASKDGRHWFVSLIGENKVLKFTNENQLIDTAEFIAPGMLAIGKEGRNLFVGRSMSAVNPPQSIGKIETETMAIEQVDTFFQRPHALSFDSATQTLYSASLSANQLMVFQTESYQQDIFRFKGPTQTYVQFALDPLVPRMIATGQVSGMLSIFNISNPTHLEETGKIRLGKMPWHPVIHPEKPIAYVPLKGEDALALVNLKTKEVEKIKAGAGMVFSKPHGSVLSQNGSLLFVSNNHDRKEPSFITVFDTEKKKVVKTLETGVYSTGIGTDGGQVSLKTDK